MTITGDPGANGVEAELTVERADDGRFAVGSVSHAPTCDCADRGGGTDHDMGFTTAIDEGVAVGDATGWAVPEEGDDAGTRATLAVSRRRFIQGLAAAGALGYVVVRSPKPVERSGVESQLASQFASTDMAAPAPVVNPLHDAPPNVDAIDELAALDQALLVPAPVDQRVLVLIDFAGGNDGLSMVVPYASNAYYDQRPNLAIAQDAVLPLDAEVGLAPALARLSQRQLAVVEGVGPIDGSLSHFEMVERWEQGDILGQGGQRSGFLARLADQVDIGGAVTGLSVAGHTPRFDAGRASTLALSNLNQLRVLTDDGWIYPQYREAVRSFGGGPMSTSISRSWNQLFSVGDSMSSDIDRVDGDSLMVREGGGLGRQLAMAAEVIKAEVGVRVIHAQLGGFDTHENHVGRHNRLMERFDAAVEGFLQEIEAAGMLDRVLVATSSEFGRRVRQNGSGLDHGAASAMLMVGPIRPGRLGEPPPLGDLDGNDNLKTTVAFDRYLASLAQEWLDVDPAAVLPNAPQPIGIF